MLRPVAVPLPDILAGRRTRLAAVGIAGLLAFCLVVLAAMPWGLFKPMVETRLSDSFGQPVTIGRLERVDLFSLSPTLAMRELRIPQARWAGRGDLVRVREARVTIPALPLLLGKVRPSAISVSGIRLSLVRDAKGRSNWPGGGSATGGYPPLADGLTIEDAVIDYRDAVQDRHLTINALAGPNAGVRLSGSGTVRGAPVTIAASAPAVGKAHAGKAWPFTARISGAALTMRVTGSMDRPLDTRHMTLDVTATADDLKLIDAVIEAGLFGTQEVRLAARARRDGDTWRVELGRGTIGRSDIAGSVVVTKGDRTKIEGTLVSNRASFDDFASDAGTERAIALERSEGLKIVPDTRINISKIDNTDGTIRFTIRELVGGRRPSSLTSLTGSVTIDHQLMTVPLTIGLEKGSIQGKVTVDQRGGRRLPFVTLDLALRNSTLGALSGDGEVDARLDGRVRLSGSGNTIREAVGNASGTIGLAARDGALPARIASLIGFDLARGLTTGDDERAGLRCAVLRLAVKDGLGRADTLTVDTTLSRSDGSGTLRFPGETLALSLTGAPKQKSVLRLPGSVTIGGTLRNPTVVAPKAAAGGILKAIGRSITGTQDPRAREADCGALITRTLD